MANISSLPEASWEVTPWGSFGVVRATVHVGGAVCLVHMS